MNARTVKNQTTIHGPPGPRDIDIDNLLTRVSSYYGPGMVLAWLLAFMSVIITWTFHRRQAVLDTITYNLMATLAYPAVAAGHMVYLIVAFPGDRAQILTTEDPKLTPYVAEIDAALCVCDTFAMLSLALTVIAMWKFQPRRFFSVMPVGMLCFEAECALFWISPTPSASNNNLSRPYSNMSRTAILTSNVVLGILLAMVFLAWIIIFFRIRFGNWGQDDEALPPVVERVQLAVASVRTIGRLPTWLSIVAMPILAFLVLTENLGAWGSTPLSEAHHSYVFIPLTNVDLKDIDQIVKLCGGACAFLCSVYEVIASAMHNDAIDDGLEAAVNGEENVELEPVQ